MRLQYRYGVALRSTAPLPSRSIQPTDGIAEGKEEGKEGEGPYSPDRRATGLADWLADVISVVIWAPTTGDEAAEIGTPRIFTAHVDTTGGQARGVGMMFFNDWIADRGRNGRGRCRSYHTESWNVWTGKRKNVGEMYSSRKER